MQPSLTPRHAGLQYASSKLVVHVATETRNTPRNIMYKKAYERAEGKKQRNLYSTPKKRSGAFRALVLLRKIAALLLSLYKHKGYLRQ